MKGRLRIKGVPPNAFELTDEPLAEQLKAILRPVLDQIEWVDGFAECTFAGQLFMVERAGDDACDVWPTTPTRNVELGAILGRWLR